MTVEAMTTNHPTCCADCSHYRGDPSYDCALVNRSMLNAEAKRPFWCPLTDAFFKMPGGDQSSMCHSETARSWIAENIATIEALASGTWQVVPVAPTEAMLDALWDGQCPDAELIDLWAKVLAAAAADRAGGS